MWVCFFFNLFIYLFIYFWLSWVFVSVRGLSLVVASGGHSSSRCAGLSLSWPLLLRSTGSRRAGSVIVAHGPSCSAACGIFPDQGSNPRPLHRQADSQPLCHQGSPPLVFYLHIPIRKNFERTSFFFFFSFSKDIPSTKDVILKNSKVTMTTCGAQYELPCLGFSMVLSIILFNLDTIYSLAMKNWTITECKY